VRFVDGDDRGVSSAARRAFAGERLGRRQHEQPSTVAQARERIAALAHADGAVESDRGDAVLDELLMLVFEQRQERRDDDGRTVEQQRRELVAERFAAARRQDQQRVLAARTDRIARPAVMKMEAEAPARRGAPRRSSCGDCTGSASTPRALRSVRAAFNHDRWDAALG
jgi:hypothetical protein